MLTILELCVVLVALPVLSAEVVAGAGVVVADTAAMVTGIKAPLRSDPVKSVVTAVLEVDPSSYTSSTVFVQCAEVVPCSWQASEYV